MKLIARVSALVFATLLLCGHPFAQSFGNGRFVLLAGTPASVSMNSAIGVGETKASADDGAGLYTIFNNFGKKPKCYNSSGDGWVVAGEDSEFGQSQYIAMSFTPKADATVTKLKLGMLWTTGTRGVVISLNEDSGGLPGNPIHTWVTSRVGKFGSYPCLYTLVKDGQGLPVQKGTQYWVVAAATGTEWDDWVFTYKGTMGEFAYDESDEGWTLENFYLATFAVLGTR